MDHSIINLLNPPPRQLPSALTRKIWFSESSILVIFFLFILAAVFAGSFISNVDVRSLYVRDSSLRRVQGQLQAITFARARENRSNIYAYTYTFNVNETPYQGESFDFQRKLPKIHDPVTVLYDGNDPHVSKIKGQRFQAFGADSLIVVLFPLILLMGFLHSLLATLRNLDVVRNGRYGTGKIIAKTRITRKKKSDIIYEVIFEFTDDAGQTHTGTARKAYPSASLSEALEPIMYLPAQPQKAILLSTLPPAVREFIERPQSAI